MSLSIAAAIECDLYMAESTIPNAGLGIFSAVERKPGDSVGHGDICIPILDLNNYHGHVWNPFNDYVWAGEVMGMKLEIESMDKEALCPVCIVANHDGIRITPSDLNFLPLLMVY